MKYKHYKYMLAQNMKHHVCNNLSNFYFMCSSLQMLLWLP